MSFPRYESYKDSGVEWLGDVPEHWEVKRLRFVAQLNPSKGETSDLDRETEVSFLPMEAIGDNGSLNLERTRAISAVETGYTYFREGDVTVAKITPCFENGKGAVMRGLLGGIGFGTTELIVARPLPSKTTSDYLHWLFISAPFRKLGEASMYGAGGQKRVPDDFVRNFAIGFPAAAEQQIIAVFLDRETAKIDALIAEQQRLIELLKEKRQAVISNAVTKGLNPDAPMKDSGIEWLGDVPEHWAPKKIAGISSLKGRLGWQGLKADEYRDHGPYVVSSAHFDNHQIDWDACPRVSQERYDIDSNIQLAPNDVLIMKDGAAMGKLAFVESLPGPACLNSHLLLFRPVNTGGNETYFPRFVFYYMQTGYFQEYIKVNGTGATFLGISQEAIGRYQIVIPPRSEQIAITSFLDHETAKLDELTAEANRAISLLQERRTALISAAVTGKVDVRGLVVDRLGKERIYE